ncbi:MAG: cytochrome P450 [Azonexus sp.]|jgi:hypothetical protein|nr:cytochrome P450 [Azonexus sp.]
MNTTEQTLLDYLGGYIRTHPAVREHIINHPDWQRLAQQELDRRAARFLDILPEAELQAIATGQVNLPNLVKTLPI